MTKLSVRACELSLALLLVACVGDTEYVDPPAEGDGDQGDGDNGDGDKGGDGDQGDGDNGDGDNGDGDGDGPSCTFPQAVYFGTIGPTAVPLSDDQVTAVAMLDLNGGLCSGTLVRPDWLLTAKHCTEGLPAQFIRVLFGREHDNPNREYSVSEKFENPAVDTTLLHLSRSPLEDDPNIQPIRINEDSLEGRVGEVFEAAGYGETESMGYGVRYFTAEPIESLDNEFVSVDGEGKHGLCGGDSGGPLFGSFPDGVRVVGDLLGGDASCVGVDTYTRTDTQMDWINSILPADGGSDCGNVSAEGRCDVDVASWCENGTLKSDNCASQGKVCRLDAAQGGYRCVVEDDCGFVTEEGECDGETAIWCNDGKLIRRNCAETDGYMCGQEEGTGNTRCVEDRCAKLGDGVCDGDVAVRCIGREVTEIDCRTCDMDCREGLDGPECI